MDAEQMLMGLGASELRRCGNAVADEFIANRLAESTTGKVCLMESICAVENRRAARQRVVFRINPTTVKPRLSQPSRRIRDPYVR